MTVTQGRDHRWVQGNLVDGGYVRYLHCGDGFTLLFLCQILVSCAIYIQLVVCRLYPSKSVRKNINFCNTPL